MLAATNHTQHLLQRAERHVQFLSEADVSICYFLPGADEGGDFACNYIMGNDRCHNHWQILDYLKIMVCDLKLSRSVSGTPIFFLIGWALTIAYLIFIALLSTHFLTPNFIILAKWMHSPHYIFGAYFIAFSLLLCDFVDTLDDCTTAVSMSSLLLAKAFGKISTCYIIGISLISLMGKFRCDRIHLILTLVTFWLGSSLTAKIIHYRVHKKEFVLILSVAFTVIGYLLYTFYLVWKTALWTRKIQMLLVPVVPKSRHSSIEGGTPPPSSRFQEWKTSTEAPPEMDKPETSTKAPPQMDEPNTSRQSRHSISFLEPDETPAPRRSSVPIVILRDLDNIRLPSPIINLAPRSRGIVLHNSLWVINPTGHIKPRALALALSPFWVCLCLLLPVVDDQRPLHGWSKYTAAIHFVVGPLLLYHFFKSYLVLYIGMGIGIILLFVILFGTSSRKRPGCHNVREYTLFWQSFIYTGFSLYIQLFAIYGVSFGMIIFKILETENTAVMFQVLSFVVNAKSDIIALLTYPLPYIILEVCLCLAFVKRSFADIAYGIIMGFPMMTAFSILPTLTLKLCESAFTSVYLTANTNMSYAMAALALVVTAIAVPITNFQLRRSFGIYLLILLGYYLIYQLLATSTIIHPYGAAHSVVHIDVVHNQWA